MTNIEPKTTTGILKELIHSQGWKLFCDLVEDNILDPIRKDLLEKEYKSIEERNLDMKLLKKLIEVIDHPQKSIQKLNTPEVENQDVYS